MAQLEGAVRGAASKSLKEARTKLEEEAFNLVVLGQFKRGKSTFINALLGEGILPTAITPLTSVVTILRYGPELKVRVEYLSGRSEEIDIADLPAFITETRKPSKQKGSKRSYGVLSVASILKAASGSSILRAPVRSTATIPRRLTLIFPTWMQGYSSSPSTRLFPGVSAGF